VQTEAQIIGAVKWKPVERRAQADSTAIRETYPISER
jgi:hypothetical protein